MKLTRHFYIINFCQRIFELFVLQLSRDFYPCSDTNASPHLLRSTYFLPDFFARSHVALIFLQILQLIFVPILVLSTFLTMDGKKHIHQFK